MSMFRRPGDSSSSSDDSSDSEDAASIPQQDSVLSRISTLDSAASERSPLERPLRPNVRQTSDQNVRDLLLHALLEKDALREAAEHLGKDRSDPEVQALGKEVYQKIARQISKNVDDMYSKQEMQTHRATAQEIIGKLTRSKLNSLATIPEGRDQALVVHNGYTMSRQPSSNFDIFTAMTATPEMQLRGYPGLQTDRYVREFAELGIVGKGGYGKVYKAKHKLDGSFYAVKRIPISPNKVAKIQEHGPQELESMLEEVRSLARFDHNNIVRYHNAWLEFSTMNNTAMPRQTTVVREDRLLEDAAAFPDDSADFDALHPNFNNLSLHDPVLMTDREDSAGVIFESSEPGAHIEESKSEENMSLKDKLRFTKRKNRRGSQASQATIATMSSTKSRMSAVEDVDEDDIDEDIEIIHRSHMPYSQEPTTEMSESMFSHSDVPGQLVQTSNTGPLLMLNVQMSLCDTNLAAFLSSEHCPTDGAHQRHCFHPCISLELLNNIIAGVEYLHAQGVVHRDLKPANVFLALSTARYPPYGSVDVSTCTSCATRECLHVIPRIGDFGLVAALDDKCLDMDVGAKPVGTEFYRPQTSKGNSEKLDVFSLGVVAFEMLQKFSTRMERIAALTDLRRGVFPAGFARSLGNIGEQVQELIGEMMQPEDSKRIGCAAAKMELGKLVHIMKA